MIYRKQTVIDAHRSMSWVSAL